MLEVEHDGDIVILTPTQALDGFERLVARRRIDELLEAGSTRLVLDLSRLRSLNSSGIGSLVAARHRADAAGGAVYLCCVNDTIRVALEVMLLHQILPICATRAEAVARARDDVQGAGGG